MPLSRRNLLIGAGGIVAAGGALVGTGAFTTVQAERTVSVETAGDQGALLGINKISGSNNSDEYASFTDNTLQVDITDVNLDAVTHIDRVFQIANNGTQDVVIYLEEQPGDDHSDGNGIDFGTLTSELANTSSVGGGSQNNNEGIEATDVVDISNPSPPSSGGYDSIGVKLGTGDSLEVGIYIDTSDENLNDGVDQGNSDVSAGDSLMDGIVIHASADAVGNEPYTAASN